MTFVSSALAIWATARSADLAWRGTMQESLILLQLFLAVVGIAGLLLAAAMAERKRLEKKLHKAHKMEALGRVIGGIAHEFNNQMTVVTGFSTMMIDELPPDSHLRQYAEAIKKAGERTAEVTQLLMAFGRLQMLRLQAFDLNCLVNKVKSVLQLLPAPPRKSATVPASTWLPPMESSSSAAATWRPKAPREKGPPSVSTCRKRETQVIPYSSAPLDEPRVGLAS